MNSKIINRNESNLKDLIIDFVGNKTKPDKDEVTIFHIAEVFIEEFPEFIMTIAEENWVNGYTQALNDVDFMKNTKEAKNELNNVCGSSLWESLGFVFFDQLEDSEKIAKANFYYGQLQIINEIKFSI